MDLFEFEDQQPRDERQRERQQQQQQNEFVEPDSEGRFTIPIELHDAVDQTFNLLSAPAAGSWAYPKETSSPYSVHSVEQILVLSSTKKKV